MLTTSIALYAYLTPKVDFTRKINNTNRFFTNDDWQRGRFENFESDHHYESNLESDVLFEIESNHEASQVPTIFLPVVEFRSFRGIVIDYQGLFETGRQIEINFWRLIDNNFNQLAYQPY